jgi:hypothetical protein
MVSPSAFIASNNSQMNSEQSQAKEAVFVKTTDIDKDAIPVKGYDFNNGVDYPALMQSLYTTGIAFNITHRLTLERVLPKLLTLLILTSLVARFSWVTLPIWYRLD